MSGGDRSLTCGPSPQSVLRLVHPWGPSCVPGSGPSTHLGRRQEPKGEFALVPNPKKHDSRCSLHSTSRSSHSRRSLSCRFFLCRVALLCLVLRRRRRLPIPCSRCFSRLSSQLCPPRGIFWPPLEFIELSSRKDGSSHAHCDHLPPSHIVAQVHSLFEHLYLHG